ncbi:hypothetical protein L226DRAFT_551286 [Lentinus tigrinus ALCF2SS1-7]|uniref:uncharacterized protein n=1 Tax=Lentinus tigrinus ALCF2SS1-7 TaxID=1328758 RepID=UPI00116623F9|nr:hypothetical protein L226DRAFT_551286 [Lentinus tigrinus ALCF2SS1-7]
MSEQSPRTSADLRLSHHTRADLLGPELWWRDHYEWLLEKGYSLRPRYRPGWKPSWREHPDKNPRDFEDWQRYSNTILLDAVRLSDNSLVALKQVSARLNPHEIEVVQFLNNEKHRSDPHNHTVPILDVLPVPDDPDVTVLVMPLLRTCDEPSWRTVGEVVAFLFQVFEGLQYMHELNVAHRDCMAMNIMYDPRTMYPNMYHPQDLSKTRDWKRGVKVYDRTSRPVRYYFIDFGISRRYNPEDGPPREHPILGGDKTAPEFKDWKGDLLDPFPTDIYYIGNMIQRTLLQNYRGLTFLAPLVEGMVQVEPSKRPTVQEVVRRFDGVLNSLDQWTLRSRVAPAKEDLTLTKFLRIPHFFRTLRYVLLRKPAIPLPS